MKHAGSIQTGDSIPKISIGKLIQEKKKLLLPISISVHHGLVDGRNVAEFIQNVKDGQNNTLWYDLLPLPILIIKHEK